MMNGQVKIQALPDIHTLPSDRESLFYYNVRDPAKVRESQHPANCAANPHQAVLATKGAGED